MHVPKLYTIPWHVQSGAKKQVPNPCPVIRASLFISTKSNHIRIPRSFIEFTIHLACFFVFLVAPRNGRSSDSRQVSPKRSMVHNTHMRNFLMHYDSLVPTIFMITFLPNCSFHMIHACVLFFLSYYLDGTSLILVVNYCVLREKNKFANSYHCRKKRGNGEWHM